MPFSVGGGIRNLKEIEEIICAGAEKVIINTFAVENPDFVREASEEFGSSTIVISIDVKKNLLGKELTYIYSGKKATKYDPVSFAKLMENKGAGEIIVNSIEHDGMMNGYDINLIRRISEVVRIPVVALVELVIMMILGRPLKMVMHQPLLREACLFIMAPGEPF